jgi:hypothetical protein
MNKIFSRESFEQALDDRTIEFDDLSLFIQYWNQSYILNQKIENFLRSEGLVEEFIDFASISRRKKSSDIEEFESLVLSEKTEKAKKQFSLEFEVEIQLKHGSCSEYEEVVEIKTSKLTESAKAILSMGLAVMLLGPVINANLGEGISFAAVPKYSFDVPLEKYKDPLLAENIRDVLSELNKVNNEAGANIAKKIVGLNLEDVGEENDVQNSFQLEQIEKKFTIEKIEHLIHSYYSYKVTNASIIAEQIYEQSKDKKLDYHILLGIIKTESDFENSKVSTTGDVSIVQINYKIWSKEFLRISDSKLNGKEKAFLIKVNDKINTHKELNSH